MIRRALMSLAIALCLSLGSAQADLMKFRLNWSGANFGNQAKARAVIWIDDVFLVNPGNNSFGSNPLYVSFFEITVRDASSGNGTFTMADFNDIFLQTGGLPLNFAQELVGQATDNDPWGTSQPGGTGGDFNMFTSSPTAPSGTYFFQLTTNGGTGSNMLLTNFTPAPEPSSFGLMAIGLAGLVGRVRRKR